MTAEIIPAGFDYALLDPRDREEVERNTSDIRKRGQRMANDIVAIGKAARRVKERLEHGQFTAWIDAEFKEEFGWSYQTLARFMQVSEHFQNSQIERFGKSALYLLSQNSTPEEAREEARDRAEAGETISHQVAKEIVTRHTWEMSREERDKANVDPWEGWITEACEGGYRSTHPAYGTVEAETMEVVERLQQKAWLRWEMANSKPSPAPPPPPAAPDPLPDDLRSELSRLGWELRGSRVTVNAGTLYTLACDGGRGATEERGLDGWEQMRDDLLADEQRMIIRKIRNALQIFPDVAYQMCKGVTDEKQRQALVAEIDAVIDSLNPEEKPAEPVADGPHLPEDFRDVQQRLGDRGHLAMDSRTGEFRLTLPDGKIEQYSEWDVVKARLQALKGSTAKTLPTHWAFVNRGDGYYQARSTAGTLTNAYETQQDVIDEVWDLCDRRYDHKQTDMTEDLLHVAGKSGWTWRWAEKKDGAWNHWFTHNSSEKPVENLLQGWIGVFRGIGGFAVDTGTDTEVQQLQDAVEVCLSSLTDQQRDLLGLAFGYSSHVDVLSVKSIWARVSHTDRIDRLRKIFGRGE